MKISSISATLLLLSMVNADPGVNVRRRQGERGLQAVCETMPTGQFHILSLSSTLAVSVSGGSTNVGADIVQSTTKLSQEDNWSFEAATGGYYRIVNEKSSLVMGISQPTKGGNVILAGNGASDGSDEWCFVLKNEGVYQIANKLSGFVLDVKGFSTSDGGTIHQWSATPNLNQLWSLSDTATIVNTGCEVFTAGQSYRITAVHSGLDVGIAAAPAVGVDVVQVAAGTSTWSFAATSNGYYNVLSQPSGLALSVEGGSASNGAIIQLEAAGASSEWCFVPRNGAYEIRNRATERAIDVANSSNALGWKIHQWAFRNGQNQKFTVTSVAGPTPTPPVSVPTLAPVTAPVVAPTSAPVPAPIVAPVVPPMGAPVPPPPATTYSDWSGPVNTPVIAVAAANLPDGRIVMWSAYTRNNFGNNGKQTWTAIYDPRDGSLTEELVLTNHDMFCPGTAMLADGTLYITGGANSKETTFFDYRTNRWTVGEFMKISRGYHSMTVLADGSLFTIGGSWSGGRGGKDGETWSASAGWNLLSNVKDAPFLTGDIEGVYRSDNHAWLFLAPNGKVFHAGPSRQLLWVTTSGQGGVTGAGNRGDDTDSMNGNALMYDIGKIFTVGGAVNYGSGVGHNRAYTIDINGPQPVVTRTGNMQFGRALHNSVLLPTGEVIVIGGRSSPKNLFSDNNSIYEAEIWSPVTGSFKTLKRMGVPRNYHSVGILMKDGRVWAAGGGLCGGCSANHQDFEILTPPYLFNSDGSRATQPVIVSAPTTVKAGDQFTVQMNSADTHLFSMVRTSAVTHSVNNDQRRIPLEVVAKSGNTFTLKLPANRNISLVGVYYLFGMTTNGVPSVAKDVRIAL